MSQPTCRLVTLGCKVNQYESQLLKETLLQNGFREAQDGECADYCIVNTCTVTATGDAKGRQIIRRLAKQNPEAKTLVMGCYAKRDPQTLLRLPNVVDVVASREELLEALGPMGIDAMADGISRFDGRKRAYVKIQDGCVLKCTYCIVPQVRPLLTSRPVAQIEDEVRRLIDNGYREIVLSGIHVGHFGIDAADAGSGSKAVRLWHLLRRLDRIPGEWRMRLTSLDTPEINDDLIGAAADCERLCPHFHPALQSGSDAVLCRMKRRYRVDRFLETLERLRRKLNNPAFTTDVIVGFPGETERDFLQTLQACRDARFMKIHAFPFSPREGTPAAEFADQIAPDLKKERCGRLSELERQLAKEYYKSLVGTRLQVLVERQKEKQAGWLRGRDEHYVPVELPGSASDIGHFVSARGDRAADFGMVCARLP